MISAEIAAEIVSLAHRAALDTEQWPHVLRRLARAVDGGSAILVDYGPDNADSPTRYPVRCGRGFRQADASVRNEA
jgi:hypothetical protein